MILTLFALCFFFLDTSSCFLHFISIVSFLISLILCLFFFFFLVASEPFHFIPSISPISSVVCAPASSIIPMWLLKLAQAREMDMAIGKNMKWNGGCLEKWAQEFGNCLWQANLEMWKFFHGGEASLYCFLFSFLFFSFLFSSHYLSQLALSSFLSSHGLAARSLVFIAAVFLWGVKHLCVFSSLLIRPLGSFCPSRFGREGGKRGARWARVWKVSSRLVRSRSRSRSRSRGRGRVMIRGSGEANIIFYIS
ncbi:hypothetical protein B0T24DRAFT_49630 [Lasiosphaeria ovina]|uniref:Uncharacterized protein n=1 Tax=Lasiosphaeria ovina TaxID=92902 RepID=A0AAE0TXQ1_9PEZI|nr:hypothetical protein B0T24DRAFT_49630 [Lasiosphaeria ovina]